MGLAQEKFNNKKSWAVAKHTETMLNKSITNAPTLAVGVKMMEKMGWKEGKGLGADDQGIIEPIKVKLNINSRGLGFTKEYGLEQVHYAGHYERFESVLMALSANKPAAAAAAIVTKKQASRHARAGKGSKLDHSNSDSSDSSSSNSSSSSSSSSDSDDDNATAVNKTKPKKASQQSLESLSKNSRGRLHYQKFTRGKDVSRYSDNDLACILGSKAHSLYYENRKKASVGQNDAQMSIMSNMNECLDGLKSTSSPSSDAEDCKYSTMNSKLTEEVNEDDVEGNYRPGFGVAFKTNSEDDDGDARPCFGINNDPDDDVQKCLTTRFAMKYASAFVKSELLPGTLTQREKSDDDKNTSDGVSKVDISIGDKKDDAHKLIKNKQEKRKKKIKKNKSENSYNHEIAEIHITELKIKNLTLSNAQSNIIDEVPNEICVDKNRKKKKDKKVKSDRLMKANEMVTMNEVKSKKNKKRKANEASGSPRIIEVQANTIDDNNKSSLNVDEEPPKKKHKKSKKKHMDRDN